VGRDQSKLTESIEKLDTKLRFLPSHWKHLQNQVDLMDRKWFTIFRKATFLHIASLKHSRPTEYAIWKEMYEQKCQYNWERQMLINRLHLDVPNSGSSDQLVENRSYTVARMLHVSFEPHILA
jgi:hypothetical protein